MSRWFQFVFFFLKFFFGFLFEGLQVLFQRLFELLLFLFFGNLFSPIMPMSFSLHIVFVETIEDQCFYKEVPFCLDHSHDIQMVVLAVQKQVARFVESETLHPAINHLLHYILLYSFVLLFITHNGLQLASDVSFFVQAELLQTYTLSSHRTQFGLFFQSFLNIFFLFSSDQFSVFFDTVFLYLDSLYKLTFQ